MCLPIIPHRPLKKCKAPRVRFLPLAYPTSRTFSRVSQAPGGLRTASSTLKFSVMIFSLGYDSMLVFALSEAPFLHYADSLLNPFARSSSEASFMGTGPFLAPEASPCVSLLPIYPISCKLSSTPWVSTFSSGPAQYKLTGKDCINL